MVVGAHGHSSIVAVGAWDHWSIVIIGYLSKLEMSAHGHRAWWPAVAIHQWWHGFSCPFVNVCSHSFVVGHSLLVIPVVGRRQWW